MNAEAVAAALDLDLDDVPICLACLSFVSMAIDGGDEREIRRWAIKMTPDLWDEGLALPARFAVARAARRGVAGAEEPLRDAAAHRAEPDDGDRGHAAILPVDRVGMFPERRGGPEGPPPVTESASRYARCTVFFASFSVALRAFCSVCCSFSRFSSSSATMSSSPIACAFVIRPS